MATDLIVNDEGTAVILQVQEKGVNVDISAASVLQIKLKRTSSSVTKTATVTNDGLDGKMQFITEPNDFNQKGKWTIQGYIELPTWKGHTQPVIVEVGAAL